MQEFLVRYYRPIFIGLMALLLALAFYLGLLQGRQATSDSVTLTCSDDVLSALKIPLGALASGAQTTDTPVVANNPSGTTPAAGQGQFLGSKNGTKYYTPGCAGAKRIKPANIIWFQNAEDARLQGYTPASC